MVAKKDGLREVGGQEPSLGELGVLAPRRSIRRESKTPTAVLGCLGAETDPLV